jgi:vaccinia related kinase
MPPKKAGPKATKLCVKIPPKTETPGKDPIVLLKEIGHGGFARIYQAENKATRKPCAVKVEPSENGCLYVEMKLFQSILTEKALTAYKAKNKLKFLGLPHLIRFGVFDCGGQSLRFIVMPLYHSSLQTYIDSKPGKAISTADVAKILPIILDAYDYLHSEGVVHADLKAENLMFPFKEENNLKVLTLIDFGMAGRLTDRAVEQPNKKKAHNGTPYFTSTDAHRGCTPTYRGDYEILGHNLLAWLGGLEKLPWKKYEKDLDKVHALKRQYIDDPKQVLKVVSASKGAKLISGVYELADATPYNEKVDNSLLRSSQFLKSSSSKIAV